MRIAVVAFLIAATFPASGLHAQTDAGGGRDAKASGFVVRASPEWAEQINGILARIAEPMQSPLLHSDVFRKILQRQCGPHVPATTAGAEADKDLLPPCVHYRHNVRVKVAGGDTLEEIALRSGLTPGAAETFTVRPRSSRKAAGNPRLLQEGDTVVVPEVPAWTDIAVKSTNGSSAARADVVSEFAKVLRCGAMDPEQCLEKRGVYLLAQPAKGRSRHLEGSKSVPTDEGGLPSPPPLGASGSAGIEIAPEARMERESVARAARAVDRAEAAVTVDAPLGATTSYTLGVPQPAPPAPAEVTAAMAPAPSAPVMAPVVAPVLADSAPAPVQGSERIPAAASQWPYDATLVGEVLAADAAVLSQPAIIGIADGGLRDAAGAPLPADVFGKLGEDPPPNSYDEDEDLYVDDLVGAGVRRPGELQDSGDVGLCPDTPPPINTWTPAQTDQASHGAMVASIAAALRARNRAPAAFPKLIFFRLLPNACADTADFRINDAGMIKAFSYLYERSDVINVSYDAIDPEDQDAFIASARTLLGNGEKLLVLPAGNDAPGDLDNAEVCPACLANPKLSDPNTVTRTLVVGAATRDLAKASYSNEGPLTVRIYAPGDTEGAVSLAGAPVSQHAPATSFAAPYVSLAIAILRSYGITGVRDIRDRLAASTWPRYGDDGRELKETGVVDLAKVAAVRHSAIEVLEETGGQTVRRTYVGRLAGRLSDIPFCDGAPIRDESVQAIRLSAASSEGTRTVTRYMRRPRPGASRKIEDGPCAPNEAFEVHFTPLDGPELTFPLRSVTEILLPWKRQ